MGEFTSSLFPITFNKSLKVETRPEMLSSDGGVVALRELDERLAITKHLADSLDDIRDQDTIIYSLLELLRTRLYLIAQGWNDADSLRHDPALIVAVSQQKGQTPLKTENT